MRRFFISQADINDSGAVISGTEAHHLSQVLRLTAGHLIELFDGEGNIYQAEIVNISKSAVETKITGRQKVEEKPPLISLSQALLKGKKMDLVFQKATELGIHRAQPMITKYSVRKRITDNQLLRWQRIALESCKQCGRQTLMNCDPAAEYGNVISQAANYDTKILFWEDEKETSLHSLSNHHWGNSVLMLIGPEGGFSRQEVNLAASEGFKVISLGKRILRAETAAISAMALIQFMLDGHRHAGLGGEK